MRILVINDLLWHAGGAETFVYTLIDNLEKRGHTVELLGSKEGEDFESFFSRWNSNKWYKITRDKIKSFRPDIIHINNCSRVLSPSVISAGLDSKIPVVFTLHDYHLFCPRLWGVKDGKPCENGFGLRCIFSNCESFRSGLKSFPLHLLKIIRVGIHRKIAQDKRIKFISPSKDLAERLKKSLGVDVSVLRYGVNIPKESTNYKKNILFVGRISKEKGLHEVAPILNKIKGYNVLVLGKGEYYSELKSKYKNIKFLGYKKNPQKYYKNAILNIVPSLWLENFPFSVLEAMSFGVCVLGSNRGGIPEQIINKKTGLIFEAGNMDDFKNKLSFLLKNPEKMKEFGKRGRETMKKLSWENMITKYEKLYTKMIADQSNI